MRRRKYIFCECQQRKQESFERIALFSNEKFRIYFVIEILYGLAKTPLTSQDNLKNIQLINMQMYKHANEPRDWRENVGY